MRAKEKVPGPTYHLIFRDEENLKKGEYTWYEARYSPIGDVDNPKMNSWIVSGPTGISEFRDCWGSLDFLKKRMELAAKGMGVSGGDLQVGKYRVSGYREAIWSDDKESIIIKTNAGDVEIHVGRPDNKF